MRIICIAVIGVFQLLTSSLLAQTVPSIYAKLKNTHDMALPCWGPYSNKYNGISHVPAENNGIRFDVIVQPSLYLRNQTVMANTQRESGYHPWQAAPDLSYFSYRYELEWKDRVYCDVSFSSVDEKSRLIKAEFVNNTTNNRSIALNILYTMDDAEQSAFLEHGTPLPVQAYLFNELWNKTQNKEYLTYFYPRLKRYYNYLGGAESSCTRKLKSNLIQTWDIFYNSGGWDDYCPQVYTHKEKLEKVVAPVINTAHQVRFAKLLKMAAWQLGYKKDVEQYNADIETYSRGLQQYAWDKASGYFGYVMHDNNGNPTGILTHSSGTNFNRGLDGCSPLIAGVCTPEQQRSIVSHLFTKGELWSDQGITAIDQSAPYYNKDGYWNGRVWMAHQWFIWKTMLDLNEPEKAVRIAKTALDVWKRETEDSYNCWENFSIETGNGGGWHQFGALSSPVLNWFSALYKPGTITYGFNVWPIAQQFSASNDSFKGSFKLFPDQQSRTAAMLVCLNDRFNYKATCNGKSIPLKKVFDGLYAVTINLEDKGEDMYTLKLAPNDK